MIIIKQGNLFHTNAPIIAHGCNCQGVMGAGVAREIKSRFPNVFTSYKQACANKTFLPGCVQVIKSESSYIANLATQEFYRRDKHAKYAKVEDVATCLNKLVQWCINHNFNRFAMPRIGAGWVVLIGIWILCQFLNRLNAITLIFLSKFGLSD